MEKYLKPIIISTNLKTPENKKAIIKWIIVFVFLGIVLSMAGYFAGKALYYFTH